MILPEQSEYVPIDPDVLDAAHAQQLELDEAKRLDNLQVTIDDYKENPNYFDEMAELKRQKAEARGHLSSTAFSSIDPTFRLDTIPESERVGPPQGSMTESLMREERARFRSGVDARPNT